MKAQGNPERSRCMPGIIAYVLRENDEKKSVGRMEGLITTGMSRSGEMNGCATLSINRTPVRMPRCYVNSPDEQVVPGLPHQP